jgi:hypothetical protein
MLAPEIKHSHGIDTSREELVEAHADAVVALFLRRG